MKKFILFLFVVFVMCFVLTGCNAVTRSFGGTQIINLPDNKKLVNTTWKETSLWVLTKDMTSNDVAKTYEFKEDSNFGALEGTVIFKEHKTK